MSKLLEDIELNEPCSFNNGKPTEFTGFYQRSMTSNKANNLDGYLEILGDYFGKLEVFSTLGWPRPPYPFQWRATSVHFGGDDDVWEGLGKSPLEAIRELYNNMKRFYMEQDIATQQPKEVV